MQLAYTILYVGDIPATVAFYEAAFGLQRRFVHAQGHWAELCTGSTTLAFCSRRLLESMGKRPQRPQPEAPCFEIAFTTHDVRGAVERAVAAGAVPVQAPEEMPWGQTVAYVADLEGFLVELCTPMDATQGQP